LYKSAGTGHRVRIGLIFPVPVVRSLPQVPRCSAGFPESGEISWNPDRIREIRPLYPENPLSGRSARTWSRRERARDPPTPRQTGRARGRAFSAHASGPIPRRIPHPAAPFLFRIPTTGRGPADS